MLTSKMTTIVGHSKNKHNNSKDKQRLFQVSPGDSREGFWAVGGAEGVASIPLSKLS